MSSERTSINSVMLTWAVLSLLIFSVIVVGQEQKIETVLLSKWAPTSLLSEAGEYISDVDPDLYWRFVDNVLSQQEALPIPDNDEGETNVAKIAAYNLLSSSNLRLMEWALTSRAYSPKVLMLQQLSAVDLPECESFVYFGGNSGTCNLDEVRKTVESGTVPDSIPLITEADHKYPSFVWKSETKIVAVLYGNLGSPLTKTLHEYLKSKADTVGYILRPYKTPVEGRVPLSGYGVELQFKSTEYKAQDDSAKAKDESQEVAGFRFEKLHELYPHLVDKLDKFQNHLASVKGKKAEFEALKAWQVQELGLQASHFTTLQGNFLESLLDVSGNFPSRASSLSSIRVPNDFKKSVSFNQKILQSHFNIDEGEGAFFLQGNYLDPDALDLFAFQETLKSEIDLMDLLKSVYHDKTKNRANIDAVLSIGSKSNTEPDLALDLRDASITWINDLEKDEEYEDWPDDLTQLFFRMGGVMLRPVRRNVFNLLLTLNADDESTTGAMLKLAQSFMAHKAPVRIGVVFCSGQEISNSIEEPRADVIRRALNYATSEEKVRKLFNNLVDAYAKNDFSSIMRWFEQAGDEYDFGKDLSCEFVKKSGRPTPGAFLNGVPLKWDSLDDFEEIVLNQLLREAQVIQIEAFNGKIGEDTDIFEHIMTKPHVQSRLNDKILDTSNAKFYSFGTEIWEPGKEPKNSLASVATSLNYLTSSGRKQTPVTVTIWVLADIGTDDGQKFLKNAVEFLQESSKHSRLALIPTNQRRTIFTKMVLNAIAENDLKELNRVLNDYSNESDELTSELNEFDEKVDLLLKTLGFPRGGKGIFINGRLIGPFTSEDTFDIGDWSLVEKFTYDSCAKHLVHNGILDDGDVDADSIMRICAALSNPAVKTRNAKRFTIPEFDSPHVVSERKDSADPFYADLVAVVDPASRHAHKMASVLSAVQHIVGQWVKIRVIFNTPPKHSELPLKSYFRFVAGDKPVDKVTFENIPRDPLFTQNIITPDNWMVEVVKGIYDLDNIKLRDLQESISSEYELEYLLVEGHCLEAKTGSPPRGLQFTLTPESTDSRASETIVMANLGYFQLKAAPGVWKLGLREGPSKEIFALEGQNKPIVVQSLQSVVVKVKVKRNPGKESTSLLDSEQESKGWFGFGSKSEQEEDVINIFSVASGHLYERLLKIMMLSVLKNTKSKVKFWFLKNYLSPTIKDVLPDMAKQYGFEYELVQYHWPRWLNPQREKQRIIWGYKILFLDVLFPLSLKKFIFVDADQIVRADMKELVDLDLEGNPYGYTPFCDSRTEMEGFRFWKKGYWKSHLGKRKYHISALYVVDLVRFRRIAAGDRLRGQYQALSQDPNSLSNLDQDLPNNMIHQVGIKSLPQEWLWCETWCDDDSKQYAKTIDLCNNPQTKEPKMDAAKRITPEWVLYDQELRDFQNRVRPNKNHDEL